jgi:hypothetical protein
MMNNCKLSLKSIAFGTLFGTALVLVSQVASATEIVTDKEYRRNLPPFDITKANIKIDPEGKFLDFSMSVTGLAGTRFPPKLDKVEGSRVFAYVWPTKIDPSAVGFEKGTGTLALAVTSHPNYDDAPNIKGREWHTHWIVMTKDGAEGCGKNLFRITDIPAGAKPSLPKTWPGLPILIDSPGYEAKFHSTDLSVRVPFANAASLKGVAFDGMTMAFRVKFGDNQPYLCSTDVYDVVSGDLVFKGKID